MAILNFGSLNIDVVLNVDEMVLSGETKNALSTKRECGGKGLNQTIALLNAGASVFHAGKIGFDGEILREKLNECGADTSYIIKDSCENGFAFIQVDSHGLNSIICSGGSNRKITEKEIDFVLSNFGENDYLLLQNEINNIDYIMKSASSRKIKIAINLAPFTKEALNYPLELVDFLIINETEGYKLSGENEPEKIAEFLNERYPKTTVILTLGEKGLLISENKKQILIPSYNVKAVDTTSAGDVFTGFFLASIINGKSTLKSAQFGAKAAALCVTRKGTSSSIPTKKEVEEADFEFRNNL